MVQTVEVRLLGVVMAVGEVKIVLGGSFAGDVSILHVCWKTKPGSQWESITILF
jgi:hypothetical protein